MTIYHIDGTQIVTVIGPGKIDVVSDDAPIIGTVEAPTISALEPDTAALGDPDVDMVVTGTGFNEMSKIVFNGNDEPTKLLSDTEVSTTIKPSLFTVAEALPVSVRTGSMVGGPLPFTFTDAAAADADESKRSTKHHRRR
jgi:hypothetical protein